MIEIKPLEVAAKHRRRSLMRTNHHRPDLQEKIVPLSGTGEKMRKRLKTSHRNLWGKKKVKPKPTSWKVVDLYKLNEARAIGEQHITIKDATLAGDFTGFSERQARVRAEKRYGELSYARYMLLPLGRWREVRHLKTWPPNHDEDDTVKMQQLILEFF